VAFSLDFIENRLTGTCKN